jgi:hypothetical protein
MGQANPTGQASTEREMARGFSAGRDTKEGTIMSNQQSKQSYRALVEVQPLPVRHRSSFRPVPLKMWPLWLPVVFAAVVIGWALVVVIGRVL